MRILVFNGSPRKKGSVSEIVGMILECLPDDVDVDLINTNDLNLEFCRGCCNCRETNKCVFSDGIEEIYEKVNKADALILASPTYWSNMSGSLKILLDRLVCVLEDFSTKIPTPKQKGKKAIIVTAARAPRLMGWFGLHHSQAIKAMKTILKEGGYKIIGKIAHTSTLKTLSLTKIPISTQIVQKTRKLSKKLCAP